MIFYFKRSTPLMYTAALRPVPYERIQSAYLLPSMLNIPSWLERPRCELILTDQRNALRDIVPDK